MIRHVPFLDVCDTQGGTQPPKSEWVSDPLDGYIRMLQIRDFTQPNQARIEYVKTKSNLKKCNDDDILIARYGASIGKILTGLAGAYNVAMAKCILDESSINRSYLLYWLKSSEFQNFILNIGSRAAQAGFNKSDLSMLEIPIPFKDGKPDLEEQKRIAAILDKADTIRRKRQQALNLADDFLRSVFLDMFGDPVTNPKGWDEVELLSLIDEPLKNGLSPSNNGTVNGHVLTLSSITGGAFSSKFVKDTAFEKSPKSHQLVNSDKFLICRGNGNIRLVGIGVFGENFEQNVCFPDTIIATTVGKKINPRYFAYIWNSNVVRRQIESKARTTNGTYKINQSILEEIKISVPDKDLQNQFSRLSQKNDERTKLLNYQLNEANALFSSLQQRSFKGEL